MPPDPLTNPIAALTDSSCPLHRGGGGLDRHPAGRGHRAGGHRRCIRRLTPRCCARSHWAKKPARLWCATTCAWWSPSPSATCPPAGHAFTLDDLISLGCVGLLRGIDKFDPAKSHKLSTYATWWIRQAISRGIAEEGRVIDLPVHLHDRLRQQRRAQNQLTQLLGREPAPEELAAHLGWSVARVAQLEQVGQETRSLNARLHADDDGKRTR